jgi:ABC-type lipoprotein release transport system permease subunit
MYQALLTNRYLTTRVIPFIAVGAVALCTALVIIVVSVMTGFVDMVRNAGKTLMGDVIISRPIQGFPHYERLIEELLKIPEVAAATPVIETLGLMEMPYGDSEGVQIYGIEPDSFAKVTDYGNALYWRPPDDSTWHDMLDNAAHEYWVVDATDPYDPISQETREEVMALASDTTLRTLLALAPQNKRQEILNLPKERWRDELPSLIDHPETHWLEWSELVEREPMLRGDLEQFLKNGQTLTVTDQGTIEDAAAPGIHISRGNQRRQDGSIEVVSQGQLWMPLWTVTITVLPISDRGDISTRANSRILRVANETRFGIYQVDDKRAMIPLHVAQDMLEMDAATEVEIDDVGNPVLDETGSPVIVGERPARVTMVLVAAAAGTTADELKERVNEVYDEVHRQLEMEGERYNVPDRTSSPSFISIKTWEEQNAPLIEPVEKERDLMRVLFSIIYLVCAGLVLSIFWSIVYEKTRDIGILRAIGASRRGVLAIFLRYGVVIGVGGAVVGLAMAYPIVRYINEIQDALAAPPLVLAFLAALPGVLALAWTGVRGGIRGLLFVAGVVISLGIFCGTPALILQQRGVDVATLVTEWWEFLLGVPLILILASFHIASGWFAKGAMIPVLVGAITFVASAAVAALIVRAHYFGGFVMWNPEVYYFTEIPNQVDWQRALGTMFLAVLFSTLGAAIPAGRAADSDPVKALRYE